MGHRLYVCDTVIGKVMAVCYNSTDWSAVANEFALRVKVRYESNELLSEVDSLLYNDKGVVSMLEKALGSAAYGSVNLAELVADSALPPLVGATFQYTNVRTWTDRHKHCSIVGCWSDPVSRLVGNMLSKLFSQALLLGTAYVCKKSVYLLTDREDHYLKMLDILDGIGVNNLKAAVGARKLQMFSHRPEAMAIRIPAIDDTEELATLVPDTFTNDVDDDSKVYIANLVEYVGEERDVIATFVTAQSVGLVAGISSADASQRVRYGRDLIYATTKVERNARIFTRLIDEGMIARSSWLKVL